LGIGIIEPVQLYTNLEMGAQTSNVLTDQTQVPQIAMVVPTSADITLDLPTITQGQFSESIPIILTPEETRACEIVTKAPGPVGTDGGRTNTKLPKWKKRACHVTTITDDLNNELLPNEGVKEEAKPLPKRRNYGTRKADMNPLISAEAAEQPR
jgi:hypothetical protein